MKDAQTKEIIAKQLRLEVEIAELSLLFTKIKMEKYKNV
jgi:hypothetical protein